MSISRTKENKVPIRLHDMIIMTAGVLLLLTMLSVWMLCGMFAKYITSGSVDDSARVANGYVYAHVWEHEAKLKEDENKNKLGEYELNPDKPKVDKNEYKAVIPGVDIPKDPYIELTTDKCEVDYALYLRVTESENFPNRGETNYVSYELTADWELLEGYKETDRVRIYKYIGNANEVKDGIFDAGKNYDLTYKGDNKDSLFELDEKTGLVKDTEKRIQILKYNMIFVSEKFDATKIEDLPFSLTFDAWLKQVD